MKHPFMSFLAALRFLTILHLSWWSDKDGQNFADGLFFFPLIGLGIGSLCLVSAALLGHILPQSLVALAGIVVLAFISGCLHIDGLADASDGLLSSRSRVEKLVIMRDSRTGAMGVVAIVFVLGGKYAALSSLSPDLLLPALLLMPLAGRCAIVLSMAILPLCQKNGRRFGAIVLLTGHHTGGLAELRLVPCLSRSGGRLFSMPLANSRLSRASVACDDLFVCRMVQEEPGRSNR